ncbi:TetR/AcrR family transcriptional regulator [Paenibacillus paridis]|uniref:TetR/AcrR family transcriptional regulator n=1 Tax=Paenibacillus paridis TaxID=2583376 RepID=UPI00112175A8|nr:TetR/AcrR family transcriptional regulator [Paenibacillus paridis]
MDRRILKTRDAIMKAFIELMAEKNFEQVTINEIAHRANLNRGTVYLHYVDKFDLLDQCVETHLGELYKLCMPSDEKSALPPKASMLRTFEYIEQHAFFYTTLMTNKSISAFRSRMTEMMFQSISEQIDMNDINKHKNKEILVQFLASAAVGVVEWWISRSMPYSANEMVEELWSLLERNQIAP